MRSSRTDAGGAPPAWVNWITVSASQKEDGCAAPGRLG